MKVHHQLNQKASVRSTLIAKKKEEAFGAMLGFVARVDGGLDAMNKKHEISKTQRILDH